MGNFLIKLPIFIIITLAFSTFLSVTNVSASDDGQEYSVEDNEDFIDIGHRGAKAYAPEETLPSFELGQNLGADYIEMDLHLTRDDHLITMHDDTLERTTNAKEMYPNRSPWNIEDFTLEEIKKLDAGSWFNKENPTYAESSYVGLEIPTLNEVLDRFGESANYYIETKSPERYPGIEEKLIEVLNDHNMLVNNDRYTNGQVILQSFDKHSLKRLHNLNSNVPLIQLGKPTLDDEGVKDLKQYADGIGPDYEDIDKDYVQKARDNDLLVHPYTVNDKEDMHELFDWGVTGMFTNKPDVLRQVVEESSDS